MDMFILVIITPPMGCFKKYLVAGKVESKEVKMMLQLGTQYRDVYERI